MSFRTVRIAGASSTATSTSTPLIPRDTGSLRIAAFVGSAFVVRLAESSIDFLALTTDAFVIFWAVFGGFTVDAPTHGCPFSDFACDLADRIIPTTARRENDAHLIPDITVGVDWAVDMAATGRKRTRVLRYRRSGILLSGGTGINATIFRDSRIECFPRTRVSGGAGVKGRWEDTDLIETDVPFVTLVIHDTPVAGIGCFGGGSRTSHKEQDGEELEQLSHRYSLVRSIPPG